VLEALYRSLVAVGFTDPIHAPLTHLPIGLVFGAVVFFVAALACRKKQLELTARHVAILALIMAFPTILFGVFDWMHFYHGVLFPAIKAKMALAGTLLVLLGAGVILGGETKLNKAWLAVLYLGAFACVMALGWLGGGIVYGRGAQSAAMAAPTTAPMTPSPPPGRTLSPTVAGRSGGDALKGQDIFRMNCSACHAGGGNIVVASLPLKGSRKLDSLTAFEAFIRKPSMPDGSAGGMPTFAEADLPDDQAADLYAYIQNQSKAWK
jgi:mono/diheme cytochrome c family protein